MNGYAVRRIRRRARRSIYKGFLVTALIFLIVSVIVMTAKMLSFSVSGNLFHQFKSIELPAMLSGTKTADLDHGWNLILVNSKNRIPGDYEAELIQLSNGKQVDERIYPELQEMFDAARADGLHLFVLEGYRTLKIGGRKAGETVGGSPRVQRAPAGDRRGYQCRSCRKHGRRGLYLACRK